MAPIYNLCKNFESKRETAVQRFEIKKIHKTFSNPGGEKKYVNLLLPRITNFT